MQNQPMQVMMRVRQYLSLPFFTYLYYLYVFSLLFQGQIPVSQLQARLTGNRMPQGQGNLGIPGGSMVQGQRINMVRRCTIRFLQMEVPQYVPLINSLADGHGSCSHGAHGSVRGRSRPRPSSQQPSNDGFAAWWPDDGPRATTHVRHDQQPGSDERGVAGFGLISSRNGHGTLAGRTICAVSNVAGSKIFFKV